MSFKILDTYLNECATKNLFAGCVCWISNKNETLFFESCGHAQIMPTKTKMHKEIIFDLASITKPMATALSIMQLYGKNELKLNDPIEKFLPAFNGKENGKKKVKQLLTHTSGLPAWYPTYLLSEDERIAYLAETNSGKKEVIYSCLGYIILGMIVEHIAGKGLDSYCHNNIYKKIGLKNVRFGPIGQKQNVAATEHSNEHEKEMAMKYGDISKISWREYLIKGEVHDGNSFYSFRGVSGNAGLFSNAIELAELTCAYLEGNIIKPNTLKLMIKDHTGGHTKRGLGWVINPYPTYLSPATFYHTGFTGTMLLVDPTSNLIVVLLANAVHPRVRIGIMNPIRDNVIKIISKTLCLKQH